MIEADQCRIELCELPVHIEPCDLLPPPEPPESIFPDIVKRIRALKANNETWRSYQELCSKDTSTLPLISKTEVTTAPILDNVSSTITLVTTNIVNTTRINKGAAKVDGASTEWHVPVFIVAGILTVGLVLFALYMIYRQFKSSNKREVTGTNEGSDYRTQYVTREVHYNAAFLYSEQADNQSVLEREATHEQICTEAASNANEKCTDRIILDDLCSVKVNTPDLHKTNSDEMSTSRNIHIVEASTSSDLVNDDAPDNGSVTESVTLSEVKCKNVSVEVREEEPMDKTSLQGSVTSDNEDLQEPINTDAVCVSSITVESTESAQTELSVNKEDTNVMNTENSSLEVQGPESNLTELSSELVFHGNKIPGMSSWQNHS